MSPCVGEPRGTWPTSRPMIPPGIDHLARGCALRREVAGAAARGEGSGSRSTRIKISAPGLRPGAWLPGSCVADKEARPAAGTAGLGRRGREPLFRLRKRNPVWLRLARLARDQPVKPLRQVPVALAEQRHDGGEEQSAHDRRVEEDRDGPRRAGPAGAPRVWRSSPRCRCSDGRKRCLRLDHIEGFGARPGHATHAYVPGIA